MGKTSHLELSRRVVAYYLMFGLAAVTWLVVGAIVVATSVLESQAETKCLAWLGEATDVVRPAALHKKADLQPLVERFQSKWGLTYCAVVSNQGDFLAHSSPSQAGRRWNPPTGEVGRWGEVQRTRYISGDSRILREYQTAIRQHGQTYGTLLMAVPDPSVWSTVFLAAEYAPAAFLCPMLVVLIGAITLRRTVRPMAEIEDQLQHLAAVPSPSEDDLQPVQTPNPVGVGWNRLVESFRNGRQRGNLDSRLGQALEGYRQKRSEQILNSLPDGIAVTDEAGSITFANKALLGLLGMGTSPVARGPLARGDETLCGKTMEECLAVEAALPSAADADAPPNGRPANPLLEANLRGRTVVVEMGRPGDTSQGVLRVARLPQYSPGGDSPGGHVWSVRDITQQKLADQMRDQFVNAATHELRTPLANIKAYAETLVLSEMMEVEKQKEFCNTINDEVTRLARFVDDLLHLSRMEVGSTSLSRRVTNMERLLREIVDKVRPQMEQKNIVLKVDLPEKLPELVLDKDKITVALVNLLGNAAKYTPEGGRARLHVETSDRVMQINVEDTGIGISVEELPKVLDKFFRSSDPRVHEQVGSGLGLSLANEIIRLHGGKLTVHSELNKGSKFTITLPMTPEEAKCSSA